MTQTPRSSNSVVKRGQNYFLNSSDPFFILTGASLRDRFGTRSEFCGRFFRRLAELPQDRRFFEDKNALFDAETVPKSLDRLEKAFSPFLKRWSLAPDTFSPHEMVFFLRRYYAECVRRLVRSFPSLRRYEIVDANAFGWEEETPPDVLEVFNDMEAAFSRLDVASYHSSGESGDLLKALYEDLMSRKVRHLLGEYYTSGDLVDFLLDQVGFDSQSQERMLDPACGSGVFLIHAIGRLRAGFPVGQDDEEVKAVLLKRILRQVAGIDINPLAVLSAKANILISIADLLPCDKIVEIPIYQADSILDNPFKQLGEEGKFDFVVGNPPWIAWDHLPEEYREATKPLWQKYGLFTLSGNEARHGGGKKDLSILMLYAAADRFLKDGGKLAFIITQTIFQTKGAGHGFRRFRLGADGPDLGVYRVDDMVGLKLFGEASNWTSAIFLEKGKKTVYPVPYFKWAQEEVGGQRSKRRRGEGRDIVSMGCLEVDCQTNASSLQNSNPESLIPNPSRCLPPIPDPSHSSSLVPRPSVALWASPIDPNDSASAWRIHSRQNAAMEESLEIVSAYTAHLGANSGGANGVFWIDILGKKDLLVRIRNVAEKNKASVECVEAEIEPELIFPLIRWRDVKRFCARPNGYLLLVQDTDSRAGRAVEEMTSRFPKTLKYLSRFETLLKERAAYRRFQSRQPFYSMYNVGPYTIARHKVVWRRMDRQINAAVVSPEVDLYLGEITAIPQETCVLIDCLSSDEAHYLCALLNSRLVNDIVQSHNVAGGKSFGSPSMMNYLPIEKFDPANARHGALAELSQEAHRLAAAGEDISCILKKIDERFVR